MDGKRVDKVLVKPLPSPESKSERVPKPGELPDNRYG
jgi:hypothetical protein